jgi:hypothetical protein
MVGDASARRVVVIPDRMITRAPPFPASRISRQALAVEPSRSRNTDAACTAATFTTP